MSRLLKLAGGAVFSLTVLTIYLLAPHSQYCSYLRVDGLLYTYDGASLLVDVYHNEGPVEVWDIPTATVRNTYNFGDDYRYITKMTMSPDGRTLLTGNAWAKPALWDNRTGQLLHLFIGHESKILAVAYSPDGQTILTSSDDHSARLWDTQTGKLRYRLIAHAPAKEKTYDESFAAHVHKLGYSPDGHTLFTLTGDGTLKIWETESGQVLHELHTDSIAIYSPDSQKLLVDDGKQPGTAFIYEVSTGLIQQTLSAPIRLLNGQYAPDGDSLVLRYSDGSIRLWNTRTGTQRFIIEPANDYQNVLLARRFDSAISEDSQRLVAIINPTTMGVWDVRTGKSLQSIRTFRPIQNFAFAPDGKTLITIDTTNAPLLWDVETGQLLSRLCPRILGQAWENVSGVALLFMAAYSFIIGYSFFNFH